MAAQTGRRPLFNGSDIDAALAVFFDGFSKVLAGVLIFLGMEFPRDTIFGKLLPGLGLGVLILHVFLWYAGNRLAKKQGDPTVTAMPGGISAGKFFVWIYMIMIPVYTKTGDPLMALSVGIAANIVCSLMTIALAFAGPLLINIIPNPALMGSLAGVSLAWLILAVFLDVFANPFIGFMCFFVIMFIYLGKIKTKLPPIIISAIIAIIATFVMDSQGYTATITQSFNDLSFSLPVPYLDIALAGFKEVIPYIPMLFAFSLAGIISAIQALAQARDCGHEYDIKVMATSVAGISIISGLFCNPFPFELLFGYKTWKERKCTTSYSLIIGGIYIVLCLTGLVSVVSSIIPAAAVLPGLLFVGIISFASAFEGEKKENYGILIIGIIIPVFEFILGKIPVEMQPLSLQVLTPGATMVAIIWASIVYFVVYKQHTKAVVTCLIGAALSLIGIIHNSTMIVMLETGFDSFTSFMSSTYGYVTLAYLLIGIICFALGKLPIRYEHDQEA